MPDDEDGLNLVEHSGCGDASSATVAAGNLASISNSKVITVVAVPSPNSSASNVQVTVTTDEDGSIDSSAAAFAVESPRRSLSNQQLITDTEGCITSSATASKLQHQGVAEEGFSRADSCVTEEVTHDDRPIGATAAVSCTHPTTNQEVITIRSATHPSVAAAPHSIFPSDIKLQHEAVPEGVSFSAVTMAVLRAPSAGQVRTPNSGASSGQATLVVAPRRPPLQETSTRTFWLTFAFPRSSPVPEQVSTGSSGTAYIAAANLAGSSDVKMVYDPAVDRQAREANDRFWSALENVFNSGRGLRSFMVALPDLEMNTEAAQSFLASRVGRELILGNCLRELKELVRVVVQAADAVEIRGWNWKRLVCDELNLVIRSFYRQATIVRKAINEKGYFSVLAPTATERQMTVGIGHVSSLIIYGEDLGSFLKNTLGGRPFPQGKELRMPIFGISIQ